MDKFASSPSRASNTAPETLVQATHLWIYLLSMPRNVTKGVTSEGLMGGLVIEAENLTLAVDKVNGDGLGVPMSGASGETSAHVGEADDIEVAIPSGGINTPVRKVANEEK